MTLLAKEVWVESLDISLVDECMVFIQNIELECVESMFSVYVPGMCVHFLVAA
jgi:hypothetical protein